MVALLGLTWGGAFLGIEMALRGITPFWLAAARIGLASSLMLAIIAYRGVPLFADPDAPKPWGMLLQIGALSTAVPFMLLSWGQQYVTSGFAGVSMASVALMVLPMAHFLIPGERLNWRKTLGFSAGFIGILLLIGARAFDSSGGELEIAGRIACIVAAGCYAISSVYMRKLPAVDPIALSGWLLVIGAVIVIPAAYIIEGPPKMPSAQTATWLLLLGLFPTAMANLLRVLVIRSAGPVFMSLTNYQVPIWSILLGALVLSEPLPGSLLLSLALVLSGVALSQWDTFKATFAKPN
ncbi:MAG: DMT family transporter [Rhodobacteraceae bacterium]|nr:DMT family transporter [Paracoccaceae bacterium]